MSTALGVQRDPAYFQKVKNFRVATETEALEIDRTTKRVRARRANEPADFWLEYDKLVIATGARPVLPFVPHADLENIVTLHSLPDAERVRTQLKSAKEIVVIGGGLIGVETCESLAQLGCRVTLVEIMPQILQVLDWEMARLVEKHMEGHGVKILTSTSITEFEGAEGRVTAVLTPQGRLPADLVIVGIGVRPNVDLARAAGLRISLSGAIQADETMRTSDPDIFAVGDCVECLNIVSGKPSFIPLGSTANKQGRVAAINICGGNERFTIHMPLVRVARKGRSCRRVFLPYIGTQTALAMAIAVASSGTKPFSGFTLRSLGTWAPTSRATTPNITTKTIHRAFIGFLETTPEFCFHHKSVRSRKAFPASNVF